MHMSRTTYSSINIRSRTNGNGIFVAQKATFGVRILHTCRYMGVLERDVRTIC